jgi:hypothetical protein
MCYKIDEDGPFAVIADAKSKGFYALFGTKNKGIVEFENAPSLICDNKIFELFDTRNVYNVELESLYQKKIKPERINTTTFDVELIASLCNKNFIEYSLNPSNLTSAEIFYLRLS